MISLGGGPKKFAARRVKNVLILIPLFLAGCLDVGNPNDTQLNRELKAIDDYIQTKSFIDVTSDNNTGIRIGITQFGAGAPPHAGQVINATFKGHLLSDWSVFETTTYSGKLEEVSGLGLRYGLESIPEGTTATIFVASNYGFGPVGTTNVPPNATLAYEVVLDKVTKTSTELTQFKTDTVAIHKYLNDSSLVATPDNSGIWYTLSGTATGATPNVYNFVTFHYVGKILSSGAVFQKGDVTNQRVFSLIDGLKVGFPHLRVGETGTFYIPSGLAYGPQGTTTIVPNANLIFEIELTGIQ